MVKGRWEGLAEAIRPGGKPLFHLVEQPAVHIPAEASTQGKHEFTYGIFEARLRVPRGKGFLPAFWLMTGDENRWGQWPVCGEIDICEVLGHEPRTNYGTLHYGLPHAGTVKDASIPQRQPGGADMQAAVPQGQDIFRVYVGLKLLIDPAPCTTACPMSRIKGRTHCRRGTSRRSFTPFRWSGSGFSPS